MYENIIFDLGGVMLNWKPQEILADFFDHDQQQITLYQDLIDSQLWQDCDRGLLSFTHVIEKLDAKYDKQTCVRFANILHTYLVPNPHALSVFEQVKVAGCKIYILSNFPKEIYRQVSARDNFFKQIDGEVISHQVQLLKPEKKIYMALLEKYNLRPETCLFIDDLQDNIAGAKACGINTVWCQYQSKLLGQLQALGVLV